jgi:hypothetical protein
MELWGREVIFRGRERRSQPPGRRAHRATLASRAAKAARGRFAHAVRERWQRATAMIAPAAGNNARHFGVVP